MPSSPQPRLAVDAILSRPGGDDPPGGEEIGRSREGRPLRAWRLGDGPVHVSLIAGCHADEPVGPETLRRLVAWLQEEPPPGVRWWIVPHANPDGEARNRAWWNASTRDADGRRIVDLVPFLRGAIRELPGDDVEFGFPDAERPAAEVRPENAAVARFLSTGAPFHLHASLHGMAFAAGPWFLLERAWIDRTEGLRNRMRESVTTLRYDVHDVDRAGEKGFTRIDRGFTTRPDSVAMRRHFLDRGDPGTADLFLPSSMEWVRARGGDPLTLVSEMPLFVGPAALWQGPDPVRPAPIARLRTLAEAREIERTAADLGIRALPIEDQSGLQLQYIDAGLEAVLPT